LSDVNAFHLGDPGCDVDPCLLLIRDRLQLDLAAADEDVGADAASHGDFGRSEPAPCPADRK
jgi:hypothetical protein